MDPIDEYGARRLQEFGCQKGLEAGGAANVGAPHLRHSLLRLRKQASSSSRRAKAAPCSTSAPSRSQLRSVPRQRCLRRVAPPHRRLCHRHSGCLLWRRLNGIQVLLPFLLNEKWPGVSTDLKQWLHGTLPSVRGASSDVSGAPQGSGDSVMTMGYQPPFAHWSAGRLCPSRPRPDRLTLCQQKSEKRSVL